MRSELLAVEDESSIISSICIPLSMGTSRPLSRSSPGTPERDEWKVVEMDNGSFVLAASLWAASMVPKLVRLEGGSGDALLTPAASAKGGKALLAYRDGVSAARHIHRDGTYVEIIVS